MSRILLYTTQFCGYCRAAKNLLRAKGLDYEEIDVIDPDKRADMVQRAGGLPPCRRSSSTAAMSAAMMSSRRSSAKASSMIGLPTCWRRLPWESWLTPQSHE